MSPLLLAAWLAVAGDLPPETKTKPDEQVEIPARCNATSCLIPLSVLKELVEAHNEHVREVAKAREAACIAGLQAPAAAQDRAQ